MELNCGRAIQGHCGGIPVEPELMVVYLHFTSAKKYVFQRGPSWNFQFMLGKGLIPGGIEKDKDRQAVFLTPTNPCGNDPEEEALREDFTIQLKASYITRRKRNHDAVYWVRLQRAQDQGIEFCSFAIITYTTVPGDCIDDVISHNGDRAIFEKLAAPRQAPKVTLKSNCHTQQQQQQQPQQPKLEDDTKSVWEQRATWESRAGVRDDTKHATEVERATVQLVLSTSEAEADTHLNGTNTKKLKEPTMVRTKNLYSSRPCEGVDGVQQRIQLSHLRNCAMWSSLS